MALSSGNFNLYACNNQFYFDTELVAGEDFEFNLTTPMSGDFGLFLNGANAISADIDIYSGGISSDSGTMPISMPLGTYVSSGVLPLYTDNRVPDSGNIDIYSRGLDSSSGNIPISFEGSVKVSGQTVNTYSFGAYLMSGVTLPTFVEGHVTFPIYSLGGAGDRPAGNLYENLPLYIGNVQASGSSLITGETMPLYIPAIPTNYSGVFPIYAMSDNGYSSGIFPIAINSRVRYSYESSMPLYFPAAVTAGVLGGEYESMPVFSMGYYGYIPVIRDTSWKISSGVFSIYTESAERAMIDLYTKCGPFGSSGDISTYAQGAYRGSGDIPLYITSEEFAESGNVSIYIGAEQRAVMPMYTLSKIEKSGDINVYQHGVEGIPSGDINTYLYGHQPVTSTLWTYFHGF